MKNYSVTIPITGVAFIDVEAEDKESAIEQALNQVTLDKIEAWEPTKQIVQGNIFYGHTNEASAEEVK